MAVHIDEKFKDASPVDTVSRILGILNEAGLSVTEKWNESGVINCYSLRVTIDGTGLGTNGKGVTKELARASGYAELMERLQTGNLGVGKIVYNDSKLVDREELLNTTRGLFERIVESMNAFEKGKMTVEKLVDKCFALEGNPEKVLSIPYYDVNSGTKIYLPAAFVRKLYSTNGLAAGNSMEEAIVQGFSEVVERYCQKQIFVNRLTPPSVPDEILKNFTTAYQIIEAIREAGFDVIIKDCSLGKGYPVVAAVLIDKTNHSYHIHLGSSPVFEIALERSLTEMFQGRNLKSTASIKDLVSQESKQQGIRNLVMAHRTGDAAYPIEFFEDKESYPLIEIKDHTNSTNVELLAGIIEYVKNLGCQLLIRDLSHMGFNTYQAIVPGMSEIYFMDFVSDIPVIEILNDVKEVRKNITKASFDQKFMFRSVCVATVNSRKSDARYSNLSRIPAVSGTDDVFLGCLYLAYLEWECLNPSGAYKYARIAETYASKESDKSYISCVDKLQGLLSLKYSLDASLSVLSKFYSEEIIEKLREVYSKNGNPFEDFIIHCVPENCSCCKYAATCTLLSRKAVIEKLNEYTKVFDNEKAFERIHSVISKLNG